MLIGMAARSAPPVSPPRGSRQRQKEETRRALLLAAKKVLARRGLAGTTTREIASEAGVAAGTFFVHFPDLGALVDALLDEHIADALAAACREASRRRGLVERLVHVSRTLFESYDANRDLSRAYLASTLFQEQEGRLLTRRLELFQRWVTQEIDAAIASGEVPELDRELAFSGFFSLYFGALVAGLSDWMPRKKQVALLERALRRLFLLEVRP